MIAAGFQSIGDRLTKALISGDFELYKSLMILPLRVTPRDGTPYTTHTEEALREDFDLYHKIIGIHGVTDIFRDVQSVEMIGPDRAIVTLITHILQRANRLVNPFMARFHMQLQGDEWRITEIESTEGHINWTLGRASVSETGQFRGTDDAET